MNIKNLVSALVMLCMLSAGIVWAGEGNMKSDATPVLGEIRLTFAKSRNKAEQRSLFGKQLYLEKEIENDWSLFGIAYHDQEFKSGYIGLNKKLGDLYVGLGVGPARYDGITHVAVNPWIYYSGHGAEGLLTVEHYSKETEVPWYYKGYLVKEIGGGVSAGIYSEKDVGVGPMLSYRIAQQAKVWLAVPTHNKPREGGMKAVMGVVLEF